MVGEFREFQVRQNTVWLKALLKFLKFCLGGTLSQPWPNAFGMRMKFSGNYASSSDPSPNSIEDKKKGHDRNLKGFCPLNIVKTKTKKTVFTSIWYYIQTEFGIYSCWQPLFRLIIQTLTLNGESAEISLGGTLKSRWGSLTLDGGMHPPASPCNLSTGWR